MRARLTIVPIALALGASCGPVDPPPPSPVPVNTCVDSCAAYKTFPGLVTPSCSSRQCTSSNSLGFTLVVSLPENPTSLDDPPGVTIAIPHFPPYLVAHQCFPFDLTCAVVPVASRPGGSLSVDRTTQVCAGRPSDQLAILPANVRFWPYWGDSTPVPAAVAGIPLLPVPARMSVNPEAPAGSGPSGTPPTRWDAIVSPGLSYEADIVPLDPSYPPIRIIGPPPVQFQPKPFINSADAYECYAPTSPRQDTTFNVVRGTGSLGGFGAYFRDPMTRRRISSLVSLPPATSGQVTILTSGEWPPTHAPFPEVVVAPPAGTPIPTYADAIAPTGTLAPVLHYPPLPTPMIVSGTVLGPDGRPIQADLVIDSTAPKGSAGGIVVCSSSDCTQSAPATTQRPLSYSTTAHAGGTGGAYSVALPPGTYDVFIIPAIGADAGATLVTLGVQAVFQPGVPLVAAGKTLIAAARATIEGTAMLADGRALVAATVEARAAVALAAAGIDRRRWPRAVSTVTDGAGKFSLSADPGTYDIVVRPQDGTGFPWLTVTSQSVAAGEVLSFAPGSELVVPAPIFMPMTLQDIRGAPLAGALVRAYFPSSKATPPSPGAPPPEVELGAWLTDSTGHFSMYIAPPR